MHVSKIISRNRRDINAVLKCEGCGDTILLSIYDDSNYYENVLPYRECPSCKATTVSLEDKGVKSAPFYPDSLTV